MGTGYIKSLDGVRAIAILLVMTFHAQITHFGWMGVQLFFVLSGYLITGILWKEKFTATPVLQKLKRFWTRRSLRIFPLYFGYLLVFGSTYLLFHFPDYYGVNFPYLASYTFNYTRTFPWWQGNPLFTHLWSLSVEEQFYLFFPLLVFITRRSAVKWVLLFFVVAAPGVRWLLGVAYAGQGVTEAVVADAVYWNTLSHLDAFFIGGLIPVLSLQSRVIKTRLWVVVTGLIVVAAGAVDYMATSDLPYISDLGYGHGKTGGYEHVWHYTVLNFFYAALVLHIVRQHVTGERGFLLRFLEMKWLVQIGKVSYGMYLFHWAILVYLFEKNLRMDSTGMRVLVFLPYAATVYGVAALSFRFYESRFLRWKDAGRVHNASPAMEAGATPAATKRQP